MTSRYLQLVIVVSLSILSNKANSQKDTAFKTNKKWSAWGIHLQNQEFGISEKNLDLCDCEERNLFQKGNAGILLSYYRNTGSKVAYSLGVGTSYGRVGTIKVPTLLAKSGYFASATGDVYYHIGKQNQVVTPFFHSGINIQYKAFQTYSSIPAGAGLRLILNSVPAVITAQLNYSFGISGQLRNNTIAALGIYFRIANRAKKSSPKDVVDSDLDGVPDIADKCPDVPGLIDNDGCPKGDTIALKPKPVKVNPPKGAVPSRSVPNANVNNRVARKNEKQLAILWAIVHFDLDKYDITPEAMVTIRKTVAFLLKHPEYKVALSGHTDLRASDDYNLVLSRNRVTAVKKQMVELGLDASRIATHYYGERIPMVNAVTEPEHLKNRRVEFLFIK